MLAEGEKLAGIAANVVVKVPLTWEGLKAVRVFAERGVQTNVTLCFSALQAMLAAKAGATYISPFVGRLDDQGADGVELLHEIRTLYDQYEFDTEILAASLRGAAHVKAAALAGADCATLPPAVFRDLIKHPLTERGLETFISDWAKTGQSIL
jgi:transaldolase